MRASLDDPLENSAELFTDCVAILATKTAAEAPVHYTAQHQNGRDQAAKPEYAADQVTCSEMPPAYADTHRGGQHQDDGDHFSHVRQ